MNSGGKFVIPFKISSKCFLCRKVVFLVRAYDDAYDHKLMMMTDLPTSESKKSGDFLLQ